MPASMPPKPAVGEDWAWDGPVGLPADGQTPLHHPGSRLPREEGQGSQGPAGSTPARVAQTSSSPEAAGGPLGLVGVALASLGSRRALQDAPRLPSLLGSRWSLVLGPLQVQVMGVRYGQGLLPLKP